MAHLTIIVGMAGSGKSRLCDELSAKRERSISVFKDATLTKDNKRRAGHECLAEIVARLLGRGEDCIMDEPHLADPEFRRLFKEFCDKFLPGVDQHWIFYEKNVLACINNVYYDAKNKGRAEYSRFHSLNEQICTYSPPTESEWPGRTLQSVYEREAAEFHDETVALRWLRAQIARLKPKESENTRQ